MPEAAGVAFRSHPGGLEGRALHAPAFDLDAFDDGPPLTHYDQTNIGFVQDTFPIEPAGDEWEQDAVRFMRSERSSPRAPVLLETRGVTKQTEIWRARDFHHSTIVAKLRASGHSDMADQLDECGTRETVMVCTGCRKPTRYYNRCDLRHCPRCVPRLTRERKEEIGWWADQITQPKHVVLTMRNKERLTKEMVMEFKAAFTKLRRRRFTTEHTTREALEFEQCGSDGMVHSYAWKGGCYTLEITNEGRGWHLHLHALVDCRFIDMRTLSVEWGRLVGQDSAVVKVKDCRKEDYLKEVSKYVVSGAELAGWCGDDVADFIAAFGGARTFGTFGTLYKRRAEWRAFVDGIQHPEQVCGCGCSTFKHMSPEEFEAWAAINGPPITQVHTRVATKQHETPRQSELFAPVQGSPVSRANPGAWFS